MVKAKLGHNVSMDIQKFRNESESQFSQMWHKLALFSKENGDQLVCYQNAIEALMVCLNSWMWCNNSSLSRRPVNHMVHTKSGLPVIHEARTWFGTHSPAFLSNTFTVAVYFVEGRGCVPASGLSNRVCPVAQSQWLSPVRHSGHTRLGERPFTQHEKDHRLPTRYCCCLVRKRSRRN